MTVMMAVRLPVPFRFLREGVSSRVVKSCRIKIRSFNLSRHLGAEEFGETSEQVMTVLCSSVTYGISNENPRQNCFHGSRCLELPMNWREILYRSNVKRLQKQSGSVWRI